MKSKIRLLQTKWNDSGLQLKIVIVFILTISVIVFTNLILYLNINSMLEQVDRIYVSNVTLNQLSDALEEVQSSMTDYLDTKSSDEVNNVVEDTNKADNSADVNEDEGKDESNGNNSSTDKVAKKKLKIDDAKAITKDKFGLGVRVDVLKEIAVQKV